MRIGRASAGSSTFTEYSELMFMSWKLHGGLFELVGNCSSQQGKVGKPAAVAFTTPADLSCLPGGTGAKLASHNQGRDRNVAGDRWRRFYRIECCGRVERRGPRRRRGLRCARP